MDANGLCPAFAVASESDYASAQEPGCQGLDLLGSCWFQQQLEVVFFLRFPPSISPKEDAASVKIAQKSSDFSHLWGVLSTNRGSSSAICSASTASTALAPDFFSVFWAPWVPWAPWAPWVPWAQADLWAPVWAASTRTCRISCGPPDPQGSPVLGTPSGRTLYYHLGVKSHERDTKTEFEGKY